MGIKGLSTFVRERFNGWLPVNFEDWSHVIIDGNNICHTLYKKNYNWLLGGEYFKFQQTLEGFFKDSGFNHPIVVFDGADYDEEKHSSWDRRVKTLQDMQFVQSKQHWNLTKITEGCKPTPLLLTSVFMDTLRKMNIEILVVSGEADNIIAALANHHRCPVLSSDADFFVFKLEHGFVHFDRYFEEKENKSLFKVQLFMSEFNLKDYDECLLIPCVFGNDFIKSSHDSKPADYSLFLKEMAENGTFLKDYPSTPRKEKKFKKAKLIYNLPDIERGSTLSLPPWAADNFKTGRFPAYLVSALRGKFFLPRVVEVIQKRSAWEISSYIRQFLYGFMGVSNAQEIIREDCLAKISEKPIAQKLLKPPVSYTNHLPADKKQDLVLAVLKCHKIPDCDIEDIFNRMEDKWKLPIAATFYWYQHKSTPRDVREDLLKSLLLSFLTCSGVISNDVPRLHDVNARTKCRHMTALHSFAQWQCVYFDAMALNYLAREPFPTTSPASLFSGEVAMWYATAIRHGRDWITDFITERSEEWELVKKLLRLVTGYDKDDATTFWTTVDRKKH